MPPIEQAAVKLLRAIVDEVAGPGKPYSADSYLPAHLIFDARSVLEQAERQQIAEDGDRVKAGQLQTVEKLGFKP